MPPLSIEVPAKIFCIHAGLTDSEKIAASPNVNTTSREPRLLIFSSSMRFIKLSTCVDFYQRNKQTYNSLYIN